MARSIDRMRHRLPLLALAAGCLAGFGNAQHGRSMRVLAPAVLGADASFTMQHPPAAAGNVFVLLWSPPFPGAVPVTLPGYAVQGLARVDLANTVLATASVLDATGRAPAWGGTIPNDPLLVGFRWDLQGVDLDVATSTITFADDELAMVVAAPPLANANMVPIPVGAFSMGSGAFTVTHPFTANELPIHGVLLTRPFWMGKFEVTQLEFFQMIGMNPSVMGGSNHPVNFVSWHWAMAYCAGRTVQERANHRVPTGYEYRLPTEAEWEYCCRADTVSEWSTGAGLGCGDANVYDAATASYCQPGAFGGQTAPVGSYPPNPWGLHDLHGNVAELCLDAWDGVADYTNAGAIDPLGTVGTEHVLRGGGCSSPALYCRSAARSVSSSAFTGVTDGFRVVLAPIR